jgi:hypothetical protein
MTICDRCWGMGRGVVKYDHSIKITVHKFDQEISNPVVFAQTSEWKSVCNDCFGVIQKNAENILTKVFDS